MSDANVSETKRSYLKSIEVDKLWGTKDVSVEFQRDINILVGKNGSGKTTLLNMVADILLLDFEALAKMSFENIRLKFVDPHKKNGSLLTVSRVGGGSKEIDIGFKIQAYADAEEVEPSVEQTISYQYRSALRLGGLLGGGTQTLEPIKPSLASFIGELASVTWISVHRKAAAQSAMMQPTFDSAVDERLEQINVRFTEYVNKVDNEQAKETEDFQKLLLQSLMLTLPNPEINIKKLRKIDIKRLQLRIFKMLESLNLEAQEDRFNEIFEKVANSFNLLKTQDVLELKDILNVSYLMQMERIANHWISYNDKMYEFYLRKNTITQRFDDFFEDKRALIGAGGRIFFFRKPKLKSLITPQQLSSGEKQLYILLMETLLAADKPSIFMADEPELSLHVLWQEKLIDAMRSLNKNAQLIFATHSPDLVGPYNNHVYDMDDETKDTRNGDR